jgi:hypothetical protein
VFSENNFLKMFSENKREREKKKTCCLLIFFGNFLCFWFEKVF